MSVRFIRWHGFPLVSWFIILYSFYLLSINKGNEAVSLSVAAFVIGAILVIIYRKKTEPMIEKEVQTRKQNSDAPNNSKPSSGTNSGKGGSQFGTAFKIITTIYALVAGLAITQAIYEFTNRDCHQDVNYTLTDLTYCFDNVTSLQDLPMLLSSDHMILLASFFTIGIAIYHCGALFLYPKTVKFVAEENTKLGIVNCLIIFLEAIILFFMASSADAIERFTLWLIVLFVIDVVWCLLNFLVEGDKEKTEARLRVQKQLSVLYVGWAHLDALFVGFLVILSLYLGSPSPDLHNWIHLILLAMIVTYVTILYYIGWKWFWNKFQLEAE